MPPTDTQRAFELLRNRIVTVQMPPGAVIQEASLITELGLGRTPIREALKLLEAHRLVTVSPRRGMFVAPINMADLAEIQEIRSALDPLCARLAATRITPPALSELESIIRQAAADDVRSDVRALLALDGRFHHLLAEVTGNQLLHGELDRLYDLSSRIWFYFLGRTAPEDLAIEALADVLEALKCHDPEEAGQAMLRHIQHFGEAFRQRF